VKCSNCKQWSPTISVEDAWVSGECRKYAPKPHLSANAGMFDVKVTHWPRTENDDWCGEWIAIPKKSKKR
jgi:hypothetical protein